MAPAEVVAGDVSPAEWNCQNYYMDNHIVMAINYLTCNSLRRGGGEVAAGLALMMFFLLLVCLSEHIDFRCRI